MSKVRLKGLNKRKSRGKWYVSRRDNGQSLISGFKGSKEDIEKYMGSDEFLSIYIQKPAEIGTKKRPEGSLGQIIDWYKKHTTRWSALSPRTKADYQTCFDWLGDELDYPAKELRPSDMATIRNKAALDRYPKFSNHLLSSLSSVFSEAVESGFMDLNPCVGIKRIHKAKKSANREWKPEEENIVFSMASEYQLTILLIAREIGSRGQDIHAFKWTNYDGSYFRYKAGKNGEDIIIPVSERLRDHLNSIERKSVFIITTSRGMPYKNEKTMQKRISEFLSKLKKQGHIGSGLTLHGLRTTLASELKRNGENDRTIADDIGDKSASMGAHYTRHVEKETNVIEAFGRRKSVVQK